MVVMNYKKCPKCYDEAFTKTEVREIFGFRTRRSGNGEILPQSNCKKCRTRIQRLRRESGLEVHRQIN